MPLDEPRAYATNERVARPQRPGGQDGLAFIDRVFDDIAGEVRPVEQPRRQADTLFAEARALESEGDLEEANRLRVRAWKLIYGGA